MQMFSSAQAKNHFGELIDAARLAPVAITKYDKPFVVVMGIEEFERVMGLIKPPERTPAIIAVSKK